MDTKLSISTTSKDGVEVSVPIDLAQMSDAERAAFLKLSTLKDAKKLSEEERELLAKRQVFLRGDGIHTSTIVRFDRTWWDFN